MRGFSGVIRSVLKFVLSTLILEYWFFKAKKIKNEREKKNKPSIAFGPNGLINNKYWNEALKSLGFDSNTIAESYFGIINKESDFDHFLGEFQQIKRGNVFISLIYKYRLLDGIYRVVAFNQIVKKYDVHVICFEGGFLSKTSFEKRESEILNWFGIKTVVFPYGADFFIMSRLWNKTYHHAYISHYPKLALQEVKIKERVEYWLENADFTSCGFTLDGIGRWDSLKFSFIAIDTEKWNGNNHKKPISVNLKLVHSPNHRKLKGTDFIIQAVNELKSEGYQVELILLEKMQNEEVKRILCEEADVLIEQVILSGYGLSGIEGMSAGLPVVSCLDEENRLRVFRRHSYLNECPIVSATPENIKKVLKVLIENKELRYELGNAGRKYVEKYYSFNAFGVFFEKIIDKIWCNREVDLMNFYDPLTPNSYNNQSPKIEHPLVENKIPESFMKTLKTK